MSSKLSELIKIKNVIANNIISIDISIKIIFFLFKTKPNTPIKNKIKDKFIKKKCILKIYVKKIFFIDNNKEMNFYSLLICDGKTYDNKPHKKARRIDKITIYFIKILSNKPIKIEITKLHLQNVNIIYQIPTLNDGFLLTGKPVNVKIQQLKK